MAQQIGLQVFNENGEIYLDLTSRPTLYLGEVDIYPTVSTGQCSGTFGVRLSEDYRNYSLFFSVEKMYINSVNLLANNYEVPGIGKYYDSSSKEVYFGWGYPDGSQINVPVRIRYGVC